MEPTVINIDYRYVLVGLAVINVLVFWWNQLLQQEIWEECVELLKQNRNFVVKLEVLKARLTKV